MATPDREVEDTAPHNEDKPPREYFHIVTRKNSGRTTASSSGTDPPGGRKRGRRRGRKPKYFEGLREETLPPPGGVGGAVVPSLMVNERQRRKMSGRFSVFLEVLKGEREFYIEEGPPLPSRRVRRKDNAGTVAPNLSVLSESLDEVGERTCVIHVKEDHLGASVTNDSSGGGISYSGPLGSVMRDMLEELPSSEAAPIEALITAIEEEEATPPPPFSDLDLHIGEPLFGSADVTDLKTFQISDPIEEAQAQAPREEEEGESPSLGSLPLVDPLPSFEVPRERGPSGPYDGNHDLTASPGGDERRFRCKLCSSTYLSFEEASRHAKAAHSSAVCEATPYGRGGDMGDCAPFRCPECERCFPTAKGRDKHHLMMHLKNSPVTCSECGQAFNGFRPLERHLRVTHDRNPAHVCDACEEEFVLGTALEHHIAIAHPPNPLKSYSKQLTARKRLFQCPQCGRKLAGGKAFRAHHEKAHGGRAFECGQCKFKTGSAHGLKRHLASVHKAIDLSLYVCAQCKGGYQHPQDLEEHYILHHQRGPTILCPFCGEKFACLEMFRFHKGKHRAFPCDFCPIGFMKQETLEEHLNTVHKNDLSKAAETLFEIRPSTSADDRVDRREAPLQGLGGSPPDPADEGANSKILEIQVDGSVEVKETPPSGSDEDEDIPRGKPPRVHHLHNTREGALRELDASNPLKGFRLKDLPKKINCPICGKLLTTKFLRTHMRSHQGSLPHKCPRCSKAYAQGTLLRKHMKNRHYEDFLKMGNKMPKKKKVRCEYCELVFEDIYMLEEHLWQHMDEKSYSCDACRIKFGMKINWMEHYKTHYFKEEKPCPNCERTFKSVGYYREHLERCQSNWTCEECGLKCDNPEVYRKHRKMEHTRDAVLHQCPHCDKAFYSKYGYHDHLITHSSQKQFACDLCNKEFKRQRPLNDHVARVHSSGSHVCGLCGLSFGDPAELRSHSREHRRLRMECGECGVVYLSRQTLDNHIAVHHSSLLSQDPFVCPHCAEVFSTQAEVKRHLPFHFPETPFVCQVSRCHKMFRKEALLRSHMARRHSRLQYFCHRCDRKFLLDSDLRKHAIEPCPSRPGGQEEKPFECVLCGFQSAHSGVAVSHVRALHGGISDPLERVAVNKWRCSLCVKLFPSRTLLTRHLEQHALHGASAEGTLVRILLSQSKAAGEALPGACNVTWDDLLPLTKVEVITQTESAETGAPVRLAAHTWQCPACFLMTGTEEGVRRHLGASPPCLEVLVGLFAARTGINAPSDLQYVIVDSNTSTLPAPAGSTKGESPPFLLDNQLQLVMNGDAGNLSNLLESGNGPSLALLEVPERKDEQEDGETLPIEVGEDADLLNGTSGVLVQMEDGRLVIPEMGAGYQLVREETDHRGTTELTYEILQTTEGPAGVESPGFILS